MSTDQKTIDWYNKNAEGFAGHVRNKDESVYHSLYEKPAMYQLVPDLRDKKVISLGCGSGEDSHYLKQQGAELSIGIDISEELIKIATKSYPNCSFKVMDMEKLDFPDNSFDFAYSSLAIHYIEDWTNVFKGVYRILKPNSFFLFSCSHPVLTAMATTEDSDEKRLKQMSITSYRNSKKLEIVGDYLHRKAEGDLGKDFDVTAWHKPIGEMVAEAKSAGFQIDNIVDPKPLEKMKEISERDYIKLSKIPEFIIFKLLKSE